MKSIFRAILLATFVLSSTSRAADVDNSESILPDDRANKERLVIDDMEDVSDWSTGSPDETTLSVNADHARQGRFSLAFANVVDHTKGEKNYPVGWPRAREDLKRVGLTDWSGYDFFECWIYAETSRESLPSSPLAVGFYHSGKKRSTHIRLDEVKKNRWTKVIIPISKLDEPADIQAVQFNISESDYQHGDRVDFFIDDMVLTRFIHPVIAEFDVRRKVIYTGDSQVMATYRLMGRRGMKGVALRLTIVPAVGLPIGAATAPATSEGELTATLSGPLVPAEYRASLTLEDAKNVGFDRRDVGFRVIEGPFDDRRQP